jgi:hypothetical protein
MLCLCVSIQNVTLPAYAQAVNQENNAESNAAPLNPDVEKLLSIYDDKELLELTAPDAPLIAPPDTISAPEQEDVIPSPLDDVEPSPPAADTPAQVPAAPPLPDAQPKVDTDKKPETSESDKEVEKKDTETVTSEKTPTPPTRAMRQFEPSFGTEIVSVFFSPKELDAYLSAITRVEEDVFYGRGLTSLDTVDDIEDALASEEETEEQQPIMYPTYYLSSILYNNPTQWAIRINGLTIDSTKNLPEKELYVRAISPYRVQLVWKPQDGRIFDSLYGQEQSEIISTLPHFNTIKHRQVAQMTKVVFDEATQTISFSLQPNQLFFSEYLKTYEGHPKDILPPKPKNEASDTPQMTDAQNSRALRNTPAVGNPSTALERIEDVLEQQKNNPSTSPKEPTNDEQPQPPQPSAPVSSPATGQ